MVYSSPAYPSLIRYLLVAVWFSSRFGFRGGLRLVYISIYVVLVAEQWEFWARLPNYVCYKYVCMFVYELCMYVCMFVVVCVQRAIGYYGLECQCFYSSICLASW